MGKIYVARMNGTILQEPLPGGRRGGIRDVNFFVDYAPKFREAQQAGYVFAENLPINPLHYENSSDLDHNDRSIASQRAQEKMLEGCDVVMLHGTDTILYTGAFLGFRTLLRKRFRDKGIELLGAIDPIDYPGSDGLDNAALAYDALNNPLNVGVTTVVDRQLLRSARALKIGRRFKSFEYPLLGRIKNGEIIYHPEAQARLIDRWLKMGCALEGKKPRGSLASDLRRYHKRHGGITQDAARSIANDYLMDFDMLDVDFDFNFPNSVYQDILEHTGVAIIDEGTTTPGKLEELGDGKTCVLVTALHDGHVPYRLLPVFEKWKREGKFVPTSAPLGSADASIYANARRAVDKGAKPTLDMLRNVAGAKYLFSAAVLTMAGIDYRKDRDMLARMFYFNVTDEISTNTNSRYIDFLEQYDWNMSEEEAMDILQKASDGCRRGKASPWTKGPTLHERITLATAIELMRDPRVRAEIQTADRDRFIRAATRASETVNRRKSKSYRGRILLVEDDDNLRDMMTQYLDMNGYRVVQASNATQAYQMYENHKKRKRDRIDGIITDLRLPSDSGRLSGTEGRGFAETVRRDDSELPLVIMTGHISSAAQLEGTPVVIKGSVTAQDEILTELEKLLERRRAKKSIDIKKY